MKEVNQRGDNCSHPRRNYKGLGDSKSLKVDLEQPFQTWIVHSYIERDME